MISADEAALSLLVRALRETLGPGGAEMLSMERGPVKPIAAARAMERSRLCLWPGADSTHRFPIWEVNDLVNGASSRRQGNPILLVTQWPNTLESLHQKVSAKLGWAWETKGELIEQGIDPEIMLNPNGKECLLDMLIDGASRGYHEFEATKRDTGIGDPSRVAANAATRSYAEEMRMAGASDVHRAVQLSLHFTGDANDEMTYADIDDAMKGAGLETIAHAVIGRAMREMWRGVESESPRKRIAGVLTRVVKGIVPRTDHSTSTDELPT